MAIESKDVKIAAISGVVLALAIFVIRAATKGIERKG